MRLLVSQDNASTPPHDEVGRCDSSLTPEDSLSLGSEPCLIPQWPGAAGPPKVQIFGADDGIDATSTTLLLGDSFSEEDEEEAGGGGGGELGLSCV